MKTDHKNKKVARPVGRLAAAFLLVEIISYIYDPGNLPCHSTPEYFISHFTYSSGSSSPTHSPLGPGRTLGGGQGPVIGLTGHLCIEFRNKVMKEFSEFLPGGPQITGPRVPCGGFGGSPVGPGGSEAGVYGYRPWFQSSLL